MHTTWSAFLLSKLLTPAICYALAGLVAAHFPPLVYDTVIKLVCLSKTNSGFHHRRSPPNSVMKQKQYSRAYSIVFFDYSESVCLIIVRPCLKYNSKYRKVGMMCET